MASDLKSNSQQKISLKWQRIVSFHLASISGVVINFGILNILVFFLGIDYRAANIIGILSAFGWNSLMIRYMTPMKR
jgi:putative flippase GtrA